VAEEPLIAASALRRACLAAVKEDGLSTRTIESNGCFWRQTVGTPSSTTIELVDDGTEGRSKRRGVTARWTASRTLRRRWRSPGGSARRREANLGSDLCSVPGLTERHGGPCQGRRSSPPLLGNVRTCRGPCSGSYQLGPLQMGADCWAFRLRSRRLNNADEGTRPEQACTVAAQSPPQRHTRAPCWTPFANCSNSPADFWRFVRHDRHFFLATPHSGGSRLRVFARHRRRCCSRDLRAGRHRAKDGASPCS
jgi:hypothetical protein